MRFAEEDLFHEAIGSHPEEIVNLGLGPTVS